MFFLEGDVRRKSFSFRLARQKLALEIYIFGVDGKACNNKYRTNPHNAVLGYKVTLIIMMFHIH